ncbi:hypothetical protein B0H13DRAFT_2047930 [Mycena leptocephala]|nr:hypothetical protein B0H13DRAFT_2047930 [Mycena leptocephala]
MSPPHICMHYSPSTQARATRNAPRSVRPLSSAYAEFIYMVADAVGVQNTNTPPDSCSDQVSTCCCNPIAFSLSMLCLNCQQDIGTGTGFDAGVGACQDYLGQCGSPQTFKLPTDIQTAVCNEKIKIDDDIYTNGWPDGHLHP